MNDEAGSSSAVPTTAAPRRSSEAQSRSGDEPNVSLGAPSFYFSRKTRLQDLIVVLDRVAWLQITVVYLLDNSFIRFALRSMVQAVYLMPKPKGFPEANVPQPYVAGVLGANVICMLFHLLNQAPRSNEAQREYLHGSLLLDFIGQKGPSSKLRLFILDVVILILQSIALAVIYEKNAADASKSYENSPSIANDESNNQDHDAEERGVMRGASVEDDSIELQDFGAAQLSSMQQAVGTTAQNHAFAVSDNIASGQALIGHFYLIDSAYSIYRAYEERRRELREADTRVAEGGLRAMHGLRQRLSEQISSRGAPG